MRLKLLILLFPFMLLASSAPILQLDTKGHTALIRDILIDNNGNIVSAGDDKCVRVWDKDGNEKRKILGEISVGNKGMIYAIALSSDNKYLAVGGFFAGTRKSGNRYSVRIYDYQSGKMLRLLKSHKDVVLGLNFSQDDKYLASASADNSVKIWNTSNWSLKDTVTTHSDDTYGIGIFKKYGEYILLSSGFDNKVSLYNLNTKEVLKTKDFGTKVQSVAISKEHIAVCGRSKYIKIYDKNLNLIKTINTTTLPHGLRFSKDEKHLICGTASSPYSVNIYDTSDYSLYKSFKKNTNLTMAVNFLDEHTAISGGGNNKEIYIWDIKTTNSVKKIAGVGDTIWAVGIDGDKIAWGNIGASQSVLWSHSGTLQKSIDLQSFKISTNTNGFTRSNTKNGSYSLKHRKGGNYGRDDGILDIFKNGTKIKSIERDSANGIRHRCYGWYHDYIISGGAGGYIGIYDVEGNQVAKLEGHTGEVWSIAIEGDRLVSGSGDQTIRVWNLKELNSDNVQLVAPSWFSQAWFDWIKKNYPSHSVSTEKGVEKFYNALLSNSDHTNANKLVKKTKTIQPMLNIFISKDDEYIAWTNNGYFTSSVSGDKYVGYHINQGVDKEARYVGSDKYFDTLYRPDIIKLTLQTGNEKKSIAFASKNKKVQSIDIASSLPPQLSLLSSGEISTTKDSIVIKYLVDSKDPVKDTIVTLNGKKLSNRGLKSKKENNTKTITVDLENGNNIISIAARNKHALSDPIYINAFKKSNVKDLFKPTLYLLSIGVSEYENPSYNLDVAHKDAEAIASMMKSQEGRIYKDVVVKTLTNKKATSDNILDGLDWIDREVTSKDVAMIFIAGHGVNDEKGNYYYLSHDADQERLRRTAVKWLEIEDTISNLPSKVILLADTCHSGNITGTRRDITSAVKSIINSGTGSVVMTATTGSGYSYEEKSWGHGAFTKALIEGIKESKADYDGDGTITIKEIDLYITNRVKKLTNGKQKPTTSIPKNVPDFAIGVR